MYSLSRYFFSFIYHIFYSDGPFSSSSVKYSGLCLAKSHDRVLYISCYAHYVFYMSEIIQNIIPGFFTKHVQCESTNKFYMGILSLYMEWYSTSYSWYSHRGVVLHDNVWCTPLEQD